MRSGKQHRGASVLLGCFAASLALHGVLSFWLRDLASTYFASSGPKRPVKLVRLSPEDWNASFKAAQEAQRRKAAMSGRPAASQRGESPRPKTEDTTKKEDKRDDRQDRLHGQVVEVAPTPDASPNPEAKFLSKYNTHVEKESVARIEDRDPSRRRVTSRLQTREQPGTPKDAIVTPGLTVRGNGQEGEKETSEKKGDGPSPFVFKVPSLEERDSLDLKLLDGPGFRHSIPNRTASEALKGNSDKLELRLGEDVNGSGSGRGVMDGRKGDERGVDQPSLPSLSGLVPTLGTVANISGSPSRDHVDGVPEGDGTFLNTKEFKYATFFYRVRDSVASRWEDLASREYRRRDPTGNIYGVKDRSTLLQIRLTRDGKLDDVQVASTSGVDFLDRVAKEAFEMAQPFPNPPPGIADADGSIRFNFQFVVTMRSRGPLNIFNFQ